MDDRPDLTGRYQHAVTAITKLLREADPEGLADIAPDDEYDPAARDLARRMLHGESMAAWVNGWTEWNGRVSRVELTRDLEALQAEMADL